VAGHRQASHPDVGLHLASRRHGQVIPGKLADHTAPHQQFTPETDTALQEEAFVHDGQPSALRPGHRHLAGGGGTACA